MLNRSFSYGFPLPSQDLIEITDMRFFIGELETDLENDELPAWDYESPVRCTAELDADLEKLLQESGLAQAADPGAARAAVSTVLVWYSTATKQRGASTPQPLRSGRNTLDFNVKGEMVGGNLEVTVVVCLSDALDPPQSTPHPWRLGTTIWESEKFVLPLEGVGSRFPMLPLDFKEAGRKPSSCLWQVEIDSDLHAPVESSVRVLVNISHPVSRRSLENPNSMEAHLWNSYLTSDTLGHLILAAARHEADNELPRNFQSGELGETLRSLLDTAFPDHAAADLLEDSALVFARAQAMIFDSEKK